VNVTQYIRPKTLNEALEALDAHGSHSLVIAGGTDLIPVMRKTRYAELAPEGDGRSSPSPSRILVDVGRLDEIRGIGQDDGFLRVGGATSIAAIAASPLLNEKVPVLTAAARSIGSPLVRNRATIGGNLATASPSADTAPALLALDAVVRLTSARGGGREVTLAGFFLDYRSTLLQDTELITDILIPVPSERAVGRFEKVGLRNADAISVVCVAAMMELEEATCLRARIALGAVAPVPVRALAVEKALEGCRVDADLARHCAALVHEHISPIDDVRGSGAYRRSVAEAVVARTIMRIVGTEDTD
jgi:carbon-monoxide dehydrogenase medium subunit